MRCDTALIYSLQRGKNGDQEMAGLNTKMASNLAFGEIVLRCNNRKRREVKNRGRARQPYQARPAGWVASSPKYHLSRQAARKAWREAGREEGGEKPKRYLSFWLLGTRCVLCALGAAVLGAFGVLVVNRL
jgi:hypothetical protein